MGYFFPKIRCTGIKGTARFNEQRLISRKEGFGLLTVYIVNSCNCDLISFICDIVGGISDLIVLILDRFIFQISYRKIL